MEREIGAAESAGRSGRLAWRAARGTANDGSFMGGGLRGNQHPTTAAVKSGSRHEPGRVVLEVARRAGDENAEGRISTHGRAAL